MLRSEENARASEGGHGSPPGVNRGAAASSRSFICGESVGDGERAAAARVDLG